MSTVKIKVGDFSKTVEKILKDYGDNVMDATNQLAKKVGQQAKKETAAGSPSRTGAYAKGWAVKDTATSTMSTEVTVYNRTRYQVAHLLEKGHAKRGGGRVDGRPHIKPAEENAIKNFEEGFEKIAKG